MDQLGLGIRSAADIADLQITGAAASLSERSFGDQIVIDEHLVAGVWIADHTDVPKLSVVQWHKGVLHSIRTVGNRQRILAHANHHTIGAAVDDDRETEVIRCLVLVDRLPLEISDAGSELEDKRFGAIDWAFGVGSRCPQILAHGVLHDATIDRAERGSLVSAGESPALRRRQAERIDFELPRDLVQRHTLEALDVRQVEVENIEGIAEHCFERIGDCVVVDVVEPVHRCKLRVSHIGGARHDIEDVVETDAVAADRHAIVFDSLAAIVEAIVGEKFEVAFLHDVVAELLNQCPRPRGAPETELIDETVCEDVVRVCTVAITTKGEDDIAAGRHVDRENIADSACKQTVDDQCQFEFLVVIDHRDMVPLIRRQWRESVDTATDFYDPVDHRVDRIGRARNEAGIRYVIFQTELDRKRAIDAGAGNQTITVGTRADPGLDRPFTE